MPTSKTLRRPGETEVLGMRVATEQERSLLKAIEALRGQERTLEELCVDESSEEIAALNISRPLVFDPERPISADEMVRMMMPDEVRDDVHRDLPALPGLSEDVLVRDNDVVEEQLAELRVTGDLLHRADLESRRPGVDDQERDPLVPREVRIGPREDAAPARELPPRDPRLLAVQPPPVPGRDRRRAKRCEIGAGLRL